MGKVSPPSIKYIVHAKFFAEGVVEKPDVIGAIFGQTEGLLGEELELRELQKKGKIGRIDASLSVEEGKTTGDIEIPTSIDKAETTIIAAAIETIDRIGPCTARFEIGDIEDVRSSKREYIIERAKKLMEKLSSGMPEIREMERDIVNHTKTARIREYGRELLAAGPDIDKSKDLIVVEGRADVLNLLRAGIKNAIAMNGTVIPETIKKLSKEKEIILFIDGDRGGVLIAKDAITSIRLASIARAPDGKEVEELTEKEIITCLRNKMDVDEFSDRYMNHRNRDNRGKRDTRVKRSVREKVVEQEEEKELEEKDFGPLTDKEREFLQEKLEEIEGTKNAFILSSPNRVMKKVSEREITRALYSIRKGQRIYAIITSGTVTPPIIRAAEKVNCKYLVAKNFAATSDRVELLSF